MPNFEYTLTDHLGNNRVTFDSSTGAGSPKQQDDYYPFGLNADRQLNAGNKYLYNKKELQDGLNGILDYGARFYDPVVGRWSSIDPSAENDASLSPYIYGFDNSIRFTDPDGRWPDGDCCGVLGAFAGGVYDDLKGAVKGTIDAVMHPVQTVTGIVKLGTDPLTQMQAGVALYGAASNGYDKFKTGDASVRAAMIGGLVGEVGQLAGGEIGEIGKVSKVGELAEAGKLVEETSEFKKIGETVHANSRASTKENTIYRLETKEGEYLKTGVTSKKNIESRYTKKYMADKNMIPLDKGSRAEMLDKEREIIEKSPGPLNKERWAGKNRIQQ